MQRRPPDFLVIGAMKAGTTFLFRRLSAEPSVVMPRTKEPGDLADDRVLTPSGLRRYLRLFARATSDQMVGEASTIYTKLPDYPGCADRASVVCPRAKIVYVIRDPVRRIISQHYHELSFGQIAERDIGAAMSRHPRLLDYSRYAYQVTPWLEAFGGEQLCIVDFDELTVGNAGFERLSRFLGIPGLASPAEDEIPVNRSGEYRVPSGIWYHIRTNPVVARGIAPYVPLGVRDRLRTALLPQPPPRPAPPTAATINAIREDLQPDQVRLRTIMDKTGDPIPHWLSC